MAEAKNGSPEGIVAASAIHTVSSNLPATSEDSNMEAKIQTNEEHETMKICPPGEVKDVEKLKLIRPIIPNLAFRLIPASASVAASDHSIIPVADPRAMIKSRSRLAGSMPARRNSGSASRVSKALRSRGFAVPRHGSRVAHRRRKLFGPPERIRHHYHGFGTVALRGVGRRRAKSSDSSSKIPKTPFSRFVQNLLNEHPSRVSGASIGRCATIKEGDRGAEIGLDGSCSGGKDKQISLCSQ